MQDLFKHVGISIIKLSIALIIKKEWVTYLIGHRLADKFIGG